MKTYSLKGADVNREWWLIDASTLPLGKLAVVIADKLMGKSKVTYTPHIDNGDYVHPKDVEAHLPPSPARDYLIKSMREHGIR